MGNYEIACCSLLGTRENQQDAYAYEKSKDGVFAIVCDGMGGMEHGEWASRTTVDTLMKQYKRKDSEQSMQDFYLENIDILDEQVCNLKGEENEPLHCGTTMVSVSIQNHLMDWFSVGDSRIYAIRKNEIVQITKDHNYKMILKERLEKKQISSQEYEEGLPQSEALISYIGMRGISLMDMNQKSLHLQSGDYILLTSDGLYREFDDKMLLATIQREKTTKKICDYLEKEYRKCAGALDNATFILIAIQ